MTITIDSPARVRNATPFRELRGVDWLTNLLLLGALWSMYAVIRNLTGETQPVAISNASSLLEIESRVGIDIERAVQAAIDWPQALMAANTYYLLHFPLTLTVLCITFNRSRSNVFPIVRNSLIGCTAVALAIHLLIPMAPPRMLPGFVDAGADFGPNPYAIAGSESANQFAAMPSMHVAWAILAGYAIWHLSPRRTVRAMAALHPIITTFVVLVTGHHFVADAAIGAAIALVLLAISAGRSRRRRPACGIVISSATSARSSATSTAPTLTRKLGAKRRARQSDVAAQWPDGIERAEVPRSGAATVGLLRSGADRAASASEATERHGSCAGTRRRASGRPRPWSVCRRGELGEPGQTPHRIPVDPPRPSWLRVERSSTGRSGRGRYRRREASS